MQFIQPDVNYDIIGKRKVAVYVSVLLIGLSLFSLIFHGGPQYGIDFAGGTVIQLQFDGPVQINAIKSALKELGLDGTVQSFGEGQAHEYLIRTDKTESATQSFIQGVETRMESATGQKAETRRVEMVGPQVGKDLRRKALLAMFYALLFITVYISGRFEMKWMVSAVMAGALMGAVYMLFLLQAGIPLLMAAALIVALVLFWFLELRYAMGAIVALIHDVFITVGIFSLFGKEFSLPIIAALLTIIGYSLNDTIIVFDRIRGNLRKFSKNPLAVTINKSINETLNRTILTSVTTLVVVICLFVLGGGIIHDFAFAMIVGVLIGTYSSIYVASPILLVWQEYKKGG